jgi:hypothetical protein
MLVVNVEPVEPVEVAGSDFPNLQVRACSPNQIGCRNLENMDTFNFTLYVGVTNNVMDCYLGLGYNESETARQRDRETARQRDR